MDILVLFGEIAYISSGTMLQGIMEGAQRDGNNVYLFTCEGFLFHDLPAYSRGEYEIFKLPDLNRYSGIIVNYNSIRNEEICRYLRGAIKASGVPCVSFEETTENSCRIDFSESSAFAEMIEHLITEHGCTDIHYISGPTDNEHSARRLKVYKEVLSKHGLISENVHYGDFDYASGKRVIQHYMETNRKLPQAFVAANDFMAIGALKELEINGYTCPEDIAIVGFDNSDVGQKMIPRLTSVDAGTFEAGAQAYDTLIKMINREPAEKQILIKGRCIVGQSCGCCVEAAKRPGSAEYINTSIDAVESLDIIKALSIHLASVGDIGEFETRISPIISRMEIDAFYYCQCGSRESYYQELENMAKGQGDENINTTYRDTMWCPVAYEMGNWSSYPAFSTNELLPPDSKRRKGSCYIVMPVHRDLECIGYCVIANVNNEFSGRVLQHLVLAIDRALGNIRNTDINKTMMARINAKWKYDELTKLNNRSGMYHKIPELIDRCQALNKGISVYFFDLDGLKKMNDSRGHNAGDKYICEMANNLLQQVRESDIAVRYGGDEFLLITMADSESECIDREKLLERNINNRVSASIGVAFGYVKTEDDFKKLIEIADKRMYENKILRKAER